MTKSKAQRRKRRRYVNKNRERADPNVKPSAMAERKKRPWTMMSLFTRGDADGISPEQFEAGIQIVDAQNALTRMLGYRAASLNDARQLAAVRYAMTDGQARWAAIYVGWSVELRRRRGDPSAICDWVQDERPFIEASDLPKLRRGLDLWANHRDEWDPAKLTEKPDGSLHSRSTLPYQPVAAQQPGRGPPQNRNAPTPTAPSRAVAQAARAARARTTSGL
jgi:hypothetical protein